MLHGCLPTSLTFPGAGSSRQQSPGQSSWYSGLFFLQHPQGLGEKKGNILFSVDLGINRNGSVRSSANAEASPAQPVLRALRASAEMAMGDAKIHPEHDGHMLHEARCTMLMVRCPQGSGGTWATMLVRKDWRRRNRVGRGRNKIRKSCWLGFPSDMQRRWCQQ